MAKDKEKDKEKDKKKPAEAKEGEEAGGNKKKKLIIIIGGVLLLLLIVGGGAFFFLGKKSGDASKTPSEQAAPEKKDEAKKDEKKEVKPEEKKDEKKDEKKEAKPEEKKDAKTGEKKDEKKDETLIHYGQTLKMKPFHMNLGNPLENRYIQLEVAIEYKGGDAQKGELEARTPQIRDAIVSVVSRKTREFLLGPDGKDQLRLEILNQVNQFVDRKVETVYITDMLIE